MQSVFYWKAFWTVLIAALLSFLGLVLGSESGGRFYDLLVVIFVSCLAIMPVAFTLAMIGRLRNP